MTTLRWLPRGGSKLATAVMVVAMTSMAIGHEHGEDKIEEGQTISSDPIDTILWMHIFLQVIAFGILFPLGMVLGIVKNRWHVPTQVVATTIAILGYFLGHMHGGREFLPSNAHAGFASPMFFFLALQVGMGVYLKLHLEKGINGRIRKVVKPAHGFVGKAFPVLSWIQMVFGGITAMGFCQGEHLGQCVAHFIMGGAFIGYAIVLTIILAVGQLWIRRTGRSQEFYDSVVIASWGCVNTFTEHHWGTDWIKNDWQHTTMGIVWWCAGLAGVWLSKDRDGNPKRNFIPGFVILITGWAMSAHPQDMPTSAMVHSMFGYTLMAAGLSRIIEVAFVLKDNMGVSEDGRQTSSFQHIPVFLLYASGFLFMGATEEQMELIAESPMDHVSYILILYSLAFITFLFVNMLIHVYDQNTDWEAISPPPSPSRIHLTRDIAAEQRDIRDAEEFELEGLSSDGEDDRLLKPRNGDLSPSTVGRNNEPVAR